MASTILDRMEIHLDGKVYKLVEVFDPPPPPTELPAVEDVHFLEQSVVKSWPVKIDLRSVKIEDSSLRFDYTARVVLPVKKPYRAEVNANMWAVFRYEGKWCAATFEWVRPNQKVKAKSGVGWKNMKPARVKTGWGPKPGEDIGFFISGMARNNQRNKDVRSEIRWLKWR